MQRMRNNLLNLFFSCFLLFFCSNSFAQEPINLAVIKQKLIQYHDSGEYEHDIQTVMQKALQYLKLNIDKFKNHPKKPSLVLDIDETALSNYHNLVKMDFGGTEDAIRAAEMKANDPPIKPILKLYEFAKANHLAIFFITSRFDFEREATEVNLRKAGFKTWDGLFFRPCHKTYQEATLFKTAVRKKISENGYHIVLNIGDQASDLDGGYSKKTFKLPDPFYLG